MKQTATSNWIDSRPSASHRLWKRRAGFTLVELVAVIVIMAILAAVAVPRYMDMQQAARTAKVEALYGDIQSAAKIAHVASLTRGDATSVPMQGATVALVNGYPAASAAGIISAANLDETRDGITIDHVAGSPPSTVVSLPGAAGNVSGGGAACAVTYYEAPAGGAPTVNKSNSSC